MHADTDRISVPWVQSVPLGFHWPVDLTGQNDAIILLIPLLPDQFGPTQTDREEVMPVDLKFHHG